MRHGGAAPLELIALQCAEDWGIPPWEVWEHEESAHWAAYRGAYLEAKHKAEVALRKT